MLGRYFKPGMIYADAGAWLLVKTRGPVVSHGVDEPIVRMTAADRDGVVRRVRVYARRRYQTAHAFPSAVTENDVSAPRRQRQSRTYGKPKVGPARSARPKPELVSARSAEAPAVPSRRRKSRPQLPQLKVASRPAPFLEACYWLPRDMSGLSQAQNAIVETLSGLPWADASALRRSTDGTLVEHDVPLGMDAVELAARVNHTTRPALRQVHAVRRALEPLVARGMVEQSPTDRRRYRLRGWQCLHSRRRTTRRAIEHGGGRALYASVAFSA